MCRKHDAPFRVQTCCAASGLAITPSSRHLCFFGTKKNVFLCKRCRGKRNPKRKSSPSPKFRIGTSRLGSRKSSPSCENTSTLIPFYETSEFLNRACSSACSMRGLCGTHATARAIERAEFRARSRAPLAKRLRTLNIWIHIYHARNILRIDKVECFQPD